MKVDDDPAPQPTADVTTRPMRSPIERDSHRNHVPPRPGWSTPGAESGRPVNLAWPSEPDPHLDPLGARDSAGHAQGRQIVQGPRSHGSVPRSDTPVSPRSPAERAVRQVAPVGRSDPTAPLPGRCRPNRMVH